MNKALRKCDAVVSKIHVLDIEIYKLEVQTPFATV